MALRTLTTKVVLQSACPYDGTQLRPHFLRHQFGVRGDVAVVFRGPCDVRGEALVDLEDREQGLFIHSRDMLHVMVEIFDARLGAMVLLQRLLCSLAADRVRGLLDAKQLVTRRGDDIFVGSGKLSVSIATVSPVSGLIHLGLNVDNQGTPVETAGLLSLGIDPERYALGLMEDLRLEIEGIFAAMCKVSPAHGRCEA